MCYGKQGMACKGWACVNRGWLIAIGALFIILGIMAILEPFLAGLAIAFLEADCPPMSPLSTPPLSPPFFGSRKPKRTSATLLAKLPVP